MPTRGKYCVSNKTNFKGWDFFKMLMGVLLVSSCPCMGHLRHHRVCTPDLEAHWPEDVWGGLGEDRGKPWSPPRDGPVLATGKGGWACWPGLLTVSAHRSACIWRAHLVLDFPPDFLQGLLLWFCQGQLGGDGIALGDQGSLLFLRQDQGAWSLQLLCRPRSRKGSKRKSRACQRNTSWGVRRVC